MTKLFYSKTLKDKLKFCGRGLHTGEYSEVILEPSKKNTGINFFLNNKKISASVENVVSTQNCTVLGTDGEKIFTVEHLLSAIYGTEITDLNIYVSGNEIPSLDGSAKEFVLGFYNVGFEILDYKKEKFFVNKEINFEINGSKYIILPGNNFSLYCEIEYRIVGKQSFNLELNPDVYREEISFAKTFCFYSDVEKLRSLGLGKGGSLENVLVIGDEGVINKDKMCYENELVRHKILDFLGDFSLLNKYFFCRINVYNPSHKSNYEFVKYLKGINL